MTTSTVLRKARRLFEAGWNESSWGSSGIRTWSVKVSIDACATDPGHLAAASRLLEHVALPDKAPSDAVIAAHIEGRVTDENVASPTEVPGAGSRLRDWLESPDRRLTEVIAVFDAATLRAKMLEGD